MFYIEEVGASCPGRTTKMRGNLSHRFCPYGIEKGTSCCKRSKYIQGRGRDYMKIRFKFFYMALAFMSLITEIFIYAPAVQAENIRPVPKVMVGSGNTDTSELPAEPGNTNTPDPFSAPVKPISRLKQVKGVCLTRYSTHSIKITWKKHKKAKFYRVYYSKKKNSRGRLAGITKNTQYMVKKLKNHTSYYFYVVACKAKKISDDDSSPSDKVHMKTRTYIRKTIFAGDSITKGIMDYGMLNKFSIKGRKKVIAAISLNTITFRTRKAFGGMTGLQKIIAEKPSRVYMMLGINEVHYRRADDILSDYRTLVHAIKQSSPGTEVVICAISPVTRTEMARYKGYSRTPAVNKKLSKLAKKTNNRFFDYTGFLKDPDGHLKARYAAGDGYHWVPSAYIKFANVISKYDKSLDK